MKRYYTEQSTLVKIGIKTRFIILTIITPDITILMFSIANVIVPVWKVDNSHYKRIDSARASNAHDYIQEDTPSSIVNSTYPGSQLPRSVFPNCLMYTQHNV